MTKKSVLLDLMLQETTRLNGFTVSQLVRGISILFKRLWPSAYVNATGCFQSRITDLIAPALSHKLMKGLRPSLPGHVQ